MDLSKIIVDIPGFPKEGIVFRDITPILGNPEAMKYVTNKIVDFAREVGADVIAAPEARGFFFGLPAAMGADIPFVPVRKPGKLPRETVTVEYELEYGTDKLEMHKDAIKPGSKVLIVDDLLATGGTVAAITRMIEKLGAHTVGYAFVAELDDLKGRDKLTDAPVLSLVHYEGE